MAEVVGDVVEHVEALEVGVGVLHEVRIHMLASPPSLTFNRCAQEISDLNLVSSRVHSS